MLEQLSCLTVSDCSMLQMIESQAPNLTTFDFEGDNLVQLSLQQSLQVRNLLMECHLEENFLCYPVTKLPYMVPNLESLTLSSNEAKRVNGACQIPIPRVLGNLFGWRSFPHDMIIFLCFLFSMLLLFWRLSSYAPSRAQGHRKIHCGESSLCR
uniref:At1g61320/AtMIF1 LRR domain-containing protein n=1 Tax=Setaria viridis TaxID=4556 RepID=A0A4U6W6D7_SETVI|nr:hypothetical protein SEVIR_1G041850v2 [Setaria viridis]